MNRVSLILAGTFLVVAATLAVTISTRPLPHENFTAHSAPRTSRPAFSTTPRVSEPHSVASSAPELSHQAPQPDSSLATLSTPAQHAPQQAPPSTQESRTTAKNDSHLPRRNPTPSAATNPQFSVKIPTEHPAAQQLMSMAMRVQAHANRNLDRLTKQLELSEEQREKLFPILARSSESYDPAMLISEASAPEASETSELAIQETLNPEASATASALTPETGELAIQEILEPEQQEERIDHALTDSLIWQEIIAGLERQLAEQSPQTTPAEITPPLPEPAPTPPASSPRHTLLIPTPPTLD